MFTYHWELTKSRASAWQWVANDERREHMIPDAYVAGKSATPIMTTADLSLRHDPFMEPIAQRFHQDQEASADHLDTEPGSNAPTGTWCPRRCISAQTSRTRH